MNFSDTLLILQEGKRVRRESWKNDMYLILNSTDTYKIIYRVTMDLKLRIDAITIESILAEDWQIYQEEK